MKDIELIYILLVAIIILLSFIFIRLGSILQEIKNNQVANNANSDDQYKQRGELLNSQNETLEELASVVQNINSNTNEIKFVSDVFYKYKLPDKKERDLFDQIEVDNEVSDGIARASEKSHNTYEPFSSQ